MIRASLASLLLIGAPAANEVKCYNRQNLIAELADKYGEAQIVRGLEDRGLMVEVYVSKPGTWTFVAVQADLRTCILATGTRWSMIAPGVLR